jgi:GT2 family glycosyltransferase
MRAVADLPSVSILVLNRDGRQDLDACFGSLQAQTYPAELVEVVLVDNGSTDDSIAIVREKYPRARVFGLEGNQGRCAPCNAAMRSCESEFVALLDHDTRVDRRWLAELVSAAQRHDAVAVASKILHWNGETIDFAGGVTSFSGQSWRSDLRGAARSTDDEIRLLFPCAGSALFSRTAFADAGGFDEDFFAYLEDLDLGWRLNLSGGRVVLAPKAVTYRRGYDASSGSSRAQRLRICERNALSAIYKNYEAATLRRILPAAVGLLLLRALMRSGIDTLPLALSDRPSAVVETHPFLAARLIALEDFCRQLPTLRRKRVVVQERRVRSDAVMFELFGDPLRLHETGGLYEDVGRALMSAFGIDDICAPARRSPSRLDRSGNPGRILARQPSEGGPPRVSIVILTALGPTHLCECLDSLRQQTYPADRVEIIVVDNGSTEDPSEVVHARFPGTRIIRNQTNIGFAAGNNQGAAAATGAYVVFLNDDTRVHPDWLRELVETARRRGAAAVASYILDWSGTIVDFAGSAVNFEGKGIQLEYGTLAIDVTPEEQPLLFACGCAMLIDRAILEDVGGWDADAFAYYEDVELGWRLNVLGYEVWLSPHAIVYHKHHGTSGRWAEAPRVRLYERNSLRGLFCLLEDEALEKVMPAALLLAADRALLEMGLSRAADSRRESVRRRLIDGGKAALRARGISRSTGILQALWRVWQRGLPGFVTDVLRLSVARAHSRRTSYLIERGGMSASFDAQLQPIPIAAAATLAGVYAFLSDIPELVERRAQVQGRRRVEDRDVLGRFGTHWLDSSPARHHSLHREFHTLLAEEFALAALTRPLDPAARLCVDEGKSRKRNDQYSMDV